MQKSDRVFLEYQNNEFYKAVLEYCSEYEFNKIDQDNNKYVLESSENCFKYKILHRDLSHFDSDKLNIEVLWQVSYRFVLYSYLDPIVFRKYIVAVFHENN